MRRKSFFSVSVILILLLLIPLALAANDSELNSIVNLLLTPTPSPSMTTTPTTLPPGERPPAPTPLFPPHRSRITNPSPTFSWTPVNGAVRYRIMVFDHKSPAERTVDIRENSPTTSIVLSVPLQPDRYFWRVRARAQGTWSRWSIRFTLWVDPPGPIDTPTFTPEPSITPSLTPTGSGLPDLYVQSARIEMQNGTECDTWGIGIDVRNQGDAAAGPFIVLADGVELPVAGLAAGQTTYVWKSGAPNPPSITVDSNNDVVESNEANNTFSQMLPIPTQPAHCLWTDTPTPTGSMTALPDLYVQMARIELKNGNNCDLGLGTAVTIHNQGNAEAGPFDVLVDGEQIPVAGLGAGLTVYVWKAGYSNPTNITVDVNGDVSESDESNNTFSQILPIPTPPIECTWTDTPTPDGPSPTPTYTPTMAVTDPPVTDPPQLVSPGNLTILTSNIVTFSVIPPANAMGIDYEVTDELGNVLITDSTGISSDLTVELPMDGNFERSFKWRARGYSIYNGPWTEYWGFQVSIVYPTDTPTPATTALPDLLVSYITNGLRPPCLGAPMGVEFGVMNDGEANVPAFMYSINGTEVPLTTPIPAQATLRVIHEDADRSIVDSGSIEVVLDPHNVVIESDESNNTMVAIPMTLTPPAETCP